MEQIETRNHCMCTYSGISVPLMISSVLGARKM